MFELFSYIRYSQAELQWGWEYEVILFLGLFVFIGLWIGYRNNQIADDQKKLAKIAAEEARKIRLRKISSLYPMKKLDE